MGYHHTFGQGALTQLPFPPGALDVCVQGSLGEGGAWFLGVLMPIRVTHALRNLLHKAWLKHNFKNKAPRRVLCVRYSLGPLVPKERGLISFLYLVVALPSSPVFIVFLS